MHGIKINYCMVICLSWLLMLASCADKDQDTKVITPTLSENNFVMEVNRKMEELPKRVMFPKDELTETDYVMYKGKKMTYTISISNAGQMVTINPGAISGKRDASILSNAYYNITKGLFAGGRFVIRVTDGGYDAELTEYGSGLPIVSSERGKLLPN